VQQTTRSEQVIFILLLLLTVLTAIPYGTVEPWWEATVIIYIFAIFIWRVLCDAWRGILEWRGKFLILPLLFLALFAYIQSLAIWTQGEPGGEWRAISFDREASWFFALKLLSLAIFLELLWRFAATEQHLKTLINVVLGITAASSLFGITKELYLPGLAEFFLPGLKTGSGFAQFINRNHFAFLMLMATGLAFGCIIGQKSRQLKIFYSGILLVLISGLALSVSRGGILAFIGEVLFLLLLYSSGIFGKSSGNKKNASVFRRNGWVIARQIAISIILFMVILGGIIWIGDEKMVFRFEKMPQEVELEENDTSSKRINLWAATLDLFKEHPAVGVGFGGYKYGISKHFRYSGRSRFEQAHNDYLELLSSGGIIGTVLAIWFFAAVIKKGRREIAESSGEVRAIKLGALTGLAGILIHSFFEFGLHVTFNALVAMILVAVLTGKFEADENEKPPEGQLKPRINTEPPEESEF